MWPSRAAYPPLSIAPLGEPTTPTVTPARRFLCWSACACCCPCRGGGCKHCFQRASAGKLPHQAGRAAIAMAPGTCGGNSAREERSPLLLQPSCQLYALMTAALNPRLLCPACPTHCCSVLWSLVVVVAVSPGILAAILPLSLSYYFIQASSGAGGAALPAAVPQSRCNPHLACMRAA